MRSNLLCYLGAAGFALAATPAAAAIQHAPVAGGAEGIYVTGEILEPDQAAFEALTRRYPKAVLYLDSPGGSLLPAIEIGKLVRAKHYSTVVLDQGNCYSACALIWLAGTPRHLAATGKIGFHASYSQEGGRLVETGVGNAIVGHYLSQLGLSEKAVIFATTASPRELMWLTAENSAEAGITYQANLTGVPAPDIELLPSRAVLQKARVAANSPQPGKGPDPNKLDRKNSLPPKP